MSYNHSNNGDNEDNTGEVVPFLDFYLCSLTATTMKKTTNMHNDKTNSNGANIGKVIW